MKVLQILHHSLTPSALKVDPRFYEGDWHVRVAKEIVKRTNKYSIECWRPETTFRRTFIRKGENGLIYRIFPSVYSTKFGDFSLPLLKSLEKEIEQNDEVIIHLHGLYNLMTYSIAFLFGKKVPIIAQSHGGYPAYVLLTQDVDSPLKEMKHPLNSLKVLLYSYVLQSLSFRNIDVFFVLSKKEQEFFSTFFNPRKVEISPMGLDLERFKPIGKEKARKMLGLDEEKLYLLYVGRLSKEKGIKYLLLGLKHALDKIPNLQLLVIGDGPMEKELKAMCRVLGIKDHVLFLGWMPNERLSLYYNAANVLIFPSLYEGWPITPLEALACKTPIITTPVGCIPHLLEDIKDGIFVVPKRDPIAIKERIIEVLNQANEISERIPSEKLKKYSWDEIIKRTITTYEELLTY